MTTFKIPPASISHVGALAMLLTVTINEKLLVPILRRAIGNARGIDILKQTSIGMVFCAPAMSFEAIVERKRCVHISGHEYFYDQVPDTMRSLRIAFFLSVLGVGIFLSSGLLNIVDRITEKTRKAWIGKELNESRLDNFYWLLVAIGGLNLCVYMLMAKRYTYKNVQKSVGG
ncbi:hypothetical protein LguiB_029470 [Lonicera macranthoides]